MDLKLKRSTLAAALAAVAVGACALQGASAQTPPPRARAYAGLAALPDWDVGVWQIGPGATARVRRGPPALTPEAQAKLDAYKAGQKQGENLQTDAANCVPPGVPQIMQMPWPIAFIYTPKGVVLITETDSQVRWIWTDGRKLSDDPDLTFNGSSVGHWEGKDLVVDTVGLDPQTMMAPGVGHSDQMRIRERFHQVGPDQMEVTTTITDPKVLTQPWTTTIPYIRHADWQIREYVCEQNNHDSADQFGRPGFRLDSNPSSPSH